MRSSFLAAVVLGLAVILGAFATVRSAPSVASATTAPATSRVIPSPLPSAGGSRSPAEQPRQTFSAGASAIPSAIPPGCLPPPVAVAPVPVVFHGPRTEKVVALTFDDGTNPKNTARILATLEREKVNATFFPTARAVELYTDVWRQVAAAGFPIANHTYRHRPLAGECFASQLAELDKADRLVKNLGFDPLPVMRAPNGSYDDATRFAAGAMGFRDIVGWDVDTRDWAGRSATYIVHGALAGTSGSIVLMHTFPGATADALPNIIAIYRSRGFAFVTVGELLGIDGSVPFP